MLPTADTMDKAVNLWDDNSAVIDVIMSSFGFNLSETLFVLLT